ncbi:MAG TPA: arginine N-succinyltransferase [Burkholderiaceae bacterium]|nr:arginine N-succinyltransferase [Burkholderiaceae bacterium]
MSRPPPTYVLRPSRLADLSHVERIARAAAIGVTSLSEDPERLLEKVRRSIHSFASDVDTPTEEAYFFVLEDPASGHIAGVSGITATAGFHDRFYSYRNEIVVHRSRSLGLSNRIHALHLCHDLSDYSLLTSFYVEPQLENTDWPQLLSRARLLYMTEHPQRFADRVAAESPGLCDDAGHCPFWDAVGRRFFNMDYAQAERIAGGRSKSFIAELMPHAPIYVPLLPEQARMAIGQLHPSAELPFSILMDEGFDENTYIDLFDGGPTVHARLDTLRTPRGSRRLPIRISHAGKDRFIALSASAANPRASIVRGRLSGGHFLLSAADAQLLELVEGDELRIAPLDADLIPGGE